MSVNACVYVIVNWHKKVAKVENRWSRFLHSTD